MKNWIFIIFVFLTTISKAQPNANVYFEKAGFGYEIYADNDEFCPVSIQLDFQLTNLNLHYESEGFFMVPPNSTKHLLTTLSGKEQNQPFGFSYSSLINYGNIHQTEYETEFEYYLPFNKDSEHSLTQGYNGTTSHANLNALDFVMPIGTKITAIRKGVVIKIIKHNTKNCTNPECKKFNNYIIIYHSDGTFAEYDHLKQNGAIVEVGTFVEKGELIGYSGNVGWSSGPHLHIMVYLQRLNTIETLKTKFLVGDGKKAILLESKIKYERYY